MLATTTAAFLLASVRGEALGLSVRDFGAVGDGVTDDAAALQRAIDASQDQKRSLLFPAGAYMTSVELVVRCTHGPPIRNPVRLVGEGRSMTHIVASAPMRSVLHLNSTDDPVSPATARTATPSMAFHSTHTRWPRTASTRPP